MTTTVVTQQGILAVVRPLVAGARRRVWVTAPWITSGAAGLLFDELVARLAAASSSTCGSCTGSKGSDDLTISDLVALDRLAAAGCQVRYSNRLHAKLVLVDDEAAVVSSSNVTASAGYATSTGDWQNEELGLALDGEPGLVTDLAREFAEIWDAAQELRPETLGIVLDPTTAAGMRVACMREPVVGEFVTLGRPEQLVGQVTAVAAWNPSVPAELGAEEAQLGLRGGGGGTRTKVPDVATLFSHPSKAHAFLMAQTFVQTSATYQIAEVAVLKRIDGGQFHASTTAVEPGEVIRRAEPVLLDALLAGDQGRRLAIGTLPANPGVAVTVDRDRLLRLHTAVLGMTGAGKSNAVKVVVRRLLVGHPEPEPGDDLSVVIVDMHDEYDEDEVCPAQLRRRIDVRFHPCVRDEVWVRRAARTGNSTKKVVDEVEVALETLGGQATREQLAVELDAAAADNGGQLAQALARLADAVRTTPALRLDEDAATEIVDAETGTPVDWSQRGCFVLGLRADHDHGSRVRKVGAVARALLRFAKETDGAHPVLFVVDEAQNFIPEQQTGLLARTRASFEPIFAIASEGRKFDCGLLLASQRPARVNKDVLSQCNTQLLFRMINLEDLDAIKGSFEAGSARLLEALPGFDTGTCYAAGVALATGCEVRMPEITAALGGTGGSLRHSARS